MSSNSLVLSETSLVSGQLKGVQVEKKLISHIPDLVVFDDNPDNIPHILKFDGVLLFADISGFTALTERYTVSIDKGTDALTVTLNNYIGKIVKNILQAGGDVLKFAGDAILAVWKVKERHDLVHAISQAARCSLIIQDKCDNQNTDVGVKLRVKIAISAGKIYTTFVGNEYCRYFVMAGRPIREVNEAEKYCTAGLVVLSPNAMELSDKDNIISEPLGDRFGLVKYFRVELKKEWKQYIDLPFELKSMKKKKKTLRLSLNMQTDEAHEAVIRKYVTPVVQRKLDDGQPLKFLSEMRQCSILFINLSFDLKEKDRLFHEKQCINMQTAFSIVHSNVRDMQGSLNKIFMFDKGCTFLVIFGLPGDKHEQEPAHALQASWKIRQELQRDLPTLTLISLGVTTGPVFCGVIGHDERHEYTVIGQKVNLAARLMMHYPNIVSCDFETYSDSKLSSDMFTKLPAKVMKGVGNVMVYDYTEGERKLIATTTAYEPEYPIIGREEEIEIFMTELKQLNQSKSFGEEKRVIIFEGEAGYGKTRVMKEIQWRAACEGVRVIAFTLSLNDLNVPFFAIKVLLNLLLKSEQYKDAEAKQKILLDLFGNSDIENLCLLNEILGVKFLVSKQVEEMNPFSKNKILHTMLSQIVHHVTMDQYVIFALDDAQNVDSDSWRLLTTLSKDSKALSVLAMRPFSPDKPPCEAAKQVIYHPKTMYVKLSVLLNEHLTPLACQLLHVERIPVTLQNILIQRSHGVPLWCEQLLKEMHNAGVILIIPITEKRGAANQVHKTEKGSDTNLKSSLSAAKMTKKVGSSTSEKDYIHKNQRNDDRDILHMECVVKPHFKLNKFPVPASIRGMALARLDRMNPFEQLVVKSAAVIGNNMSRKMLKSVVPGFHEEKFRRAIHQLMLSRVFECASPRQTVESNFQSGRKDSFQYSGRSYRITCFCSTTTGVWKGHILDEDEAISLSCQQFRFHNSLVRETAYKLWLKNQRRSLHESCACFLETKVNEILVSSVPDEIISKQYHLSKNSTEQLPMLKEQTDAIAKANTSSQNFSILRRVSEFSRKLSIGSKQTISSLSSRRFSGLTASNKTSSLFKALQKSRQRASISSSVQTSSLSSNLSEYMPLKVKELLPPLDVLILSSKDKEDNEINNNETEAKSQESINLAHYHGMGVRGASYVEKERAKLLPLWAQTVGVSSSYEQMTKAVEEKAKKLPGDMAYNKLGSLYDIHENLSLLYNHLFHHWRNAANTEKTLFFLIKAAESFIATMNLGSAMYYLHLANEIVINLDKGTDIVSNLTANDEHIDGIKVHSVSREIKARILKLTGVVLFQQGKFELALTPLLKALKVLRCRLPRNYFLINIRTWSEVRRQNMHLKKPERFIGSASYSMAVRCIEQAQCLSYVWQILPNIKHIPNRKKLWKLVAYLQINRAESADYNLQELITSYSNMMQFHQMEGDLYQSISYENKATTRCLDLPHKVSSSSLYILAHLHLVCCSIRLCHGNLNLAASAGYRAYDIAGFLGDVDVKLIALPLLAQIHLLTGRSETCIEILGLLLQSSKHGDGIEILSYYICCLDLIMDAGFSIENPKSCIEFLQNTEADDIGNVQRFYVRSSMAVWFYRRNEVFDGENWLKLATQVLPISFDNYFSVRALTRLAEARLLAFYQSKKNPENTEDARKIDWLCRDGLKRLQKLCKQFPLFFPRLFHLTAFHHLLCRNSSLAMEQLLKAINLAQYCGNYIDHQWAIHSKALWFIEDSPKNQSYWLHNCESMPDWEYAKNINQAERTFAFKTD